MYSVSFGNNRISVSLYYAPLEFVTNEMHKMFPNNHTSSPSLHLHSSTQMWEEHIAILNRMVYTITLVVQKFQKRSLHVCFLMYSSLVPTSLLILLCSLKWSLFLSSIECDGKSKNTPATEWENMRVMEAKREGEEQVASGWVRKVERRADILRTPFI